MNVHPFYLPRRIRRDEAERHGFDPGEQPTPVPTHLRAGEDVDRLAVFAAEVDAVRATFDKEAS